MEALAGLSTLSIVLLVVIFLCAVPGLITGWMLKASGRSFFWGFVLGIVFGPLGFLVALIFVLVGKPPQQQHFNAPMPALYAEPRETYTEPTKTYAESLSNSITPPAAAIIVVVCVSVIGFVIYSTLYLRNDPPKLSRAKTSSLLPVQPTQSAPVVIPTPLATPSVQSSVSPSPASPALVAETNLTTPPQASDEDLQSIVIAGENLAHGGSVQDLPRNFRYKRETGQDTGVPVFSLVPNEEAMAYDGDHGNTFEAVGMLTQPEREKFGIVFINAKATAQLQGQKEKGVLLRIDGEEFKIADYTIVASETLGKLSVESAAITIDRNIFQKLVKADDIFIRVGVAMYSLDQDNIDALHYYGAEIERDLKRRKKL